MFVFWSSSFCMIFANLLTVSKLLGSHASIPPPKRSEDHHPTGFTNFAKRLEDEFLGVPSKSVQVEWSHPAEMTVFRLPTHIRPRSYALKMVVDREKFEFFGKVKINVSVSENTNSVLLHSHRLEIRKVALYYKNDEKSTSFILDPGNQLLRIQTNSTLLKNEFYEIKVDFGGKLNTEYKGVYRSASFTGSTTK